MYSYYKHFTFVGKLKSLFDGVSGLESSPLLNQSHMSGIHPFMSAESINLETVSYQTLESVSIK